MWITAHASLAASFVQISTYRDQKVLKEFSKSSQVVWASRDQLLVASRYC